MRDRGVRRLTFQVQLVAVVALIVSAALPISAAAVPAGPPTPPDSMNAAPLPLTFTFKTTAYTIRSLAPTEWPYYTTTVVPLEDTGVHDEFGVRMYEVNGVLYNHPVAQAQYAIALIYSYLQTSDPAYLSRAEAQAQRLIDTAVAARDAIYFPYEFSFARHGVASDTMVPPWFSAMAQGQALTVFVRLYEITASAAYLDAAVATYKTFVNLRAPGVPWTVFVDTDGYVWFEEYPKDPPDRTYNGQVFATYGLWDYYRLTQEPDALALMRGGLTTIARYFPTIRLVNWTSRYCVTHLVPSATYHLVHIGQMLKLYTVTGDVQFGRDADLLNADYPYPYLNGTVRFSGGTHTGYKFNASGAVAGSKTATLSRASSAPFGARQRIRNRGGLWYLITAGIWAGYWIQEVPTKSYAQGALAWVLAYNPVRTVTFSAGTYTGYTFNTAGAITSAKTWTLGKTSTAHADRLVVINGVQHLAITDGIWAGRYVPLSSKISY